MPTYVQHIVFNHVQDVFNAEALWQTPGLALFSRKPALRDLLERHPREHKGRTATRCFAHVQLLLPRDEVEDDRHLARGNRARELAQALRELHRKDLGDLLGGEEIRYQVQADDSLEPGQVGVKFGHAVYVPDEGERFQYQVSSSSDSAVWKPVCPIYAKQRLALIGGDGCLASVSAPGWPFGQEGGILLINDGPEHGLEVQMRPKEAFDCRLDSQKGWYVVTARDGGFGGRPDAGTRPGFDSGLCSGPGPGAAPRLLLKLSRMGAASPSTARDPAAGQAAGTQRVWQPRPAGAPAGAQTPLTAPRAIPPAIAQPTTPAASNAPTAHTAHTAHTASAAADPDLTALPQVARPTPRPALRADFDLTFAPAAPRPATVTLVALALPRLSGYRQTGVAALEIGFTPDLQPASPQAGARMAICFETNSDDELSVRTPTGRQRIAAPACFTPVDAREVRLTPPAPEMAERYCATLSLPLPLSETAAAGQRHRFGRGAAALAGLRLLDSPQFLRHESEAEIATADRIGLSRNAFSFETAPDGFLVVREAPNQALYHLDGALRFVRRIDSGAPYALPDGHHLVAGHYVLRFER